MQQLFFPHDINPQQPQAYELSQHAEQHPWLYVRHRFHCDVIPAVDVLPHFDLRCPCLPRVVVSGGVPVQYHRTYDRGYPQVVVPITAGA